MLNVQSAKDYGKNARLKMIVYGESGVGKTVFSAGMPKAFIIAAEEGLLSVAGSDVDYVAVKQWAQVEEIYLHLLKAESRKKYQTVVVDSLTNLQQLALAAVLENNKHDFPELRDWGNLLELMRRFFRQMVDLPYNIVFVCLEGYMKDEGTGIVTVKPAITGRMADEAPAYVDIVMHLIVEEAKKGGEVTRTRFGIFQPDRRAIAKDRSGRLPIAMREPTASKVLAKVRGEEARTSTTTRRRTTNR